MKPCPYCNSYFKNVKTHQKTCIHGPEAWEPFDCPKCHGVIYQKDKSKHLAWHKKRGE